MTDLVVEEKWICRLEKIFRAIRCTDQDRVHWVMYRLEGQADQLWRTEERLLEDATVEALTWDGFKECFFSKYFPSHIRIRMEDDFLKLQ